MQILKVVLDYGCTGRSYQHKFASPFYQNFGYNYSASDYILYNGTGSTIPAVFNGKIGSGQGFFVRMLEDGETDVLPPTNLQLFCNIECCF